MIQSMCINDWCEKSDQEVAVGQVLFWLWLKLADLWPWTFSSARSFWSSQVIRGYQSQRSSLVPQWWRICLLIQESQVQSVGCEVLLKEEMATHSSILAWEIAWTEERGVWRAIIHGVTKSWALNSNWTTTNQSQKLKTHSLEAQGWDWNTAHLLNL